MKNSRFFIFSVALVLSMHFFGFVFMQIESTKPLFVALTPLNLLVSTALLLYFHSVWNKYFIAFCVLTAFGGYWVEVAGVHTELIFGKYQYGNTLGFKVLEVPVLIAVNWLLLTYSIGSAVSECWNFCSVGFSLRFGEAKKHFEYIFKILISALFMTMLDVAIEPFAIANELWHWYGEPVPFQNYVGWFVFSAIFASFFHLFPFPKQNPLAKWIVVSQVFFFLAHLV